MVSAILLEVPSEICVFKCHSHLEFKLHTFRSSFKNFQRILLDVLSRLLEIAPRWTFSEIMSRVFSEVAFRILPEAFPKINPVVSSGNHLDKHAGILLQGVLGILPKVPPKILQSATSGFFPGVAQGYHQKTTRKASESSFGRSSRSIFKNSSESSSGNPSNYCCGNI